MPKFLVELERQRTERCWVEVELDGEPSPADAAKAAEYEQYQEDFEKRVTWSTYSRYRSTAIKVVPGGFAPGVVVEFVNPMPEEIGVKMTILEDNGDRVLVESPVDGMHDLYPRETIAKIHLVPVISE